MNDIAADTVAMPESVPPPPSAPAETGETKAFQPIDLAELPRDLDKPQYDANDVRGKPAVWRVE
jgi:hypothetical protein